MMTLIRDAIDRIASWLIGLLVAETMRMHQGEPGRPDKPVQSGGRR